jgi:hypothetical protein
LSRGTGKKIKFCCSDFLPELQKIDRMTEGEQYLACLKHVDHLLEQEPGRDRACLLAARCRLLGATDQPEAARKAVAKFLAKHPDNQIALSEAAVLLVARDARGALRLLQRALRAAAGAVSSRTYEALGLVAGGLLRAGFGQSARALWQLQADIVEEDERVLNVLAAMSRAGDIPLLLREDAPMAACPADAPWKERFEEAARPLNVGDWQTVAERFAALAAEFPAAPSVWRNLALVRGWLADNAGSSEAWRKYAALRAGEPDGLEDAVEAEATAMFLSNDPLGDRLKMFKLVWTVKEAERAQEALSSSPRTPPVPFDPAQFSDEQSPPPKAACMLLDRPMPDSAEGLSLETVPRLLGQALLYGRQTDREARLEVMGVAADEVPAVMALVREVAGEALAQHANQEVVGEWSASQKLLRAAWQPPRGISGEQLRAMLVEYLRRAIMEQWPNLKLGVLDGRSPREAAADEKYRVRVMAAIMVLAYWVEQTSGQLDVNELRSQLGLPALEPIDPRRQPLDGVPTTRIGRVEAEGLTDEELVLAYLHAGTFGVRPAMRKFAEAIAKRPSFAGRDEQLDAFATLARTEEDLDRALEYVEQGRRATEAKKHPSGSWDLMELSLRFSQRNGQEAMRLIDHLQRQHLEEPGVAEALTRMLIDVGLLNPDGTPAIEPEMAEAAAAQEEASAGEPGKLWTPDSAEPSGGGGKLWTPG